MMATGSDRDIRKRNREDQCRERFEMWLMSNAIPSLGRSEIAWQYEPCGHNKPPDYLLTLKGQQFVVEITFIPHMEVVAGVPLEEESVTSAMADIVDGARAECLSQGILSVFYIVHFTAGIPRLRKAKLSIVTQLIKYVDETRADYDAPKRSITLGGREVCTVVKVHSMIAYISPARSIARTGGVTLCDIVAGTVAEKARLLSGIDQPSILALPRILLLDADDRSETPSEWRHCLENHPSTGDFHSVIVVPGIQPVFTISLAACRRDQAESGRAGGWRGRRSADGPPWPLGIGGFTEGVWYR